MSAESAVDRIVTNQPSQTVVVDDDPLARLFIDETLPCGIRMLAMAEPVHRTQQGYLTAATALVAFEEALCVAAPSDIDTGLERAFAAANAAVRAANRAMVVNQRAYAGITAVVIDGCEATIGLVPPGQVLIMQDGRMYGVPDLESWAPNYVPRQESESPEPLGINPLVRPLLRRTTIGQGDQFVLGTSAVGRVLAGGTVTPVADLPSTVVIKRLEDALEASGVNDAYAAWIRVDAAPAAQPIAPERMAELDRVWSGQAPVAPPALAETFSDPRLRRAQAIDRFQDRVIEASERLLARREPESLPLESKRRANVPPGAASLHRYTPPSPIAFGPSLRCRLPRGPRVPLSKRSLLGIFVVGAMIVTGALGYDVRQARADKQDEFLNDARTALQRANEAGSNEEALYHLEEAKTALDEALNSGADEVVIAQWRDQAAQVEDRLAGVNRLTDITKIGLLPTDVGTSRSRLIVAGEQLYLVSDRVYAVDASGLHLMPVLSPGEKIDRTTVGTIVSATVDGDTLIVTDGKSLFSRSNHGRWSAEKLAPSGSAGWKGITYGAYQGSFYLLDLTTTPQIKKFPDDRLDEAPENWLVADEPVDALGHAVDMVVDRSIHVLAVDGTVLTLHKGKEKRTYAVEPLSEHSSYVGLDGGTGEAYLYVLEVSNRDTRLIRYDRTKKEAGMFLPVGVDHLGYNPNADEALANATDFVVDDRAGVIYFVTADSIWRASLS